jgi:hypothetical protein
MEKRKVWFVLELGAFPKEGSGGIELQEHRIVSAIGADARYIHRTIGAERDPGSPKPPDGGPVPDPLPAKRSIRRELYEKDSGAGITEWIPGEAVGDAYDVRRPVSRGCDSLGYVAAVTALGRLRQQRLGLCCCGREANPQQSD